MKWVGAFLLVGWYYLKALAGACQSRVLYGENVVYNRCNVGRIVCMFSFSRWRALQLYEKIIYCSTVVTVIFTFVPQKISGHSSRKFFSTQPSIMSTGSHRSSNNEKNKWRCCGYLGKTPSIMIKYNHKKWSTSYLFSLKRTANIVSIAPYGGVFFLSQ